MCHPQAHSSARTMRATCSPQARQHIATALPFASPRPSLRPPAAPGTVCALDQLLYRILVVHTVDWRVGLGVTARERMVSWPDPSLRRRLTDINTTLSPSLLPLFPLLIPSRKPDITVLETAKSHSIQPVSQTTHIHPSTCADPIAPAALAAPALVAELTENKGRPRPGPYETPHQDAFSVVLASELTGLPKDEEALE